MSKTEIRKSNEREKKVIRASIVGIIANVFLASFKAMIGLLTHSIAITMDAVNNLSDVLSSVVTIFGTYLAGKEADKKHPYGHGRIEYLSTATIAMIILYAGITSFLESVKKIMHPSTPTYSMLPLMIIAVAVLVKIFLSRFVKKVGMDVNSDSLVASGADAMLDAVISTSTLVAAGIYLFFHVSLEAWLAAIISGIIIKSGIDMLRSTISEILGERVDSHLTKKIKKSICEVEGVQGAYDLILHNYGPDTYQGSVHVAVSDVMTADQIDEITRQIQKKIFAEFHILMVAVGIYSINTKNDHASMIRNDILKLLNEHTEVLQMHGFYINEKEKTMNFDVIIDFDAEDRHEVFRQITEEIQQKYPGYSINIIMDYDISD